MNLALPLPAGACPSQLTAGCSGSCPPSCSGPPPALALSPPLAPGCVFQGAWREADLNESLWDEWMGVSQPRPTWEGRWQSRWPAPCPPLLLESGGWAVVPRSLPERTFPHLVTWTFAVCSCLLPPPFPGPKALSLEVAFIEAVTKSPGGTF